MSSKRGMRGDTPFSRTRALAAATAAVAGLAAGCGGDDPGLPEGAAPIGTGPAYQPSSLASGRVRAGRPVRSMTCAAGRPRRATAHVELFARGRVVILPAGVGIAPPRREEGAYVRGGRCRYPLWTEEPTGLVDLARGGLTVGDLFAVWGRPLGRDRLASFRLPVRAWVAGRPWRGDPRAIPLRHHAQIVLQAGGPVVAPHARYRFPPGR